MQETQASAYGSDTRRLTLAFSQSGVDIRKSDKMGGLSLRIPKAERTSECVKDLLAGALFSRSIPVPWFGDVDRIANEPVREMDKR